MNRELAFQLFEEMIILADRELYRFTQSQKLNVDHKVDKTVVTGCDRQIDKILSMFAQSKKLSVISEEGKKENEIVKSGNYLTIDPIDGSLGYIDHVNHALTNGGIKTFLTKDLGPNSDFCLLLGIVEDGFPRFACFYHYITKEKILLDASDKNKCIIQNAKRKSSEKTAIYIDPRPGEEIQNKICKMPGVATIHQAALGPKSIYTILNNHEDAITIHRVQHAGLWDILPTAVAIRAFGGLLLDDRGNDVVYNKYILLPGKGATCIKGNKFLFVRNELKKNGP